MADRVIGGTPKGTKSLCLTCRAAHHVSGLNLQHVVYCQKLNPSARITFPVETCSGYDDKRVPALYQMEEIAWQVQSRNRGAVGFAGGRDLTIQIVPPSEANKPSPPQATPTSSGEDTHAKS
jgi:hypothetical protein